MAPKYLVITPKDFESTLGSLLDQKRGRGYEVVIKYVEDFLEGATLAEQIRQFVRTTVPACLLLVGDYDRVPGYKMPGTHANPPTPYLSDAYFGMGDVDVVPNLPTGRLSVTSTDELERICARLLAYPEDTGRVWRRRVILTGWLPWERDGEKPDDSGWGFVHENQGYFDPVYRFESDDKIIQDRSYNLTRDLWQVRNSTRATLAAAINTGATIVRYLGHGLADLWDNIGDARESFTRADVAALQVGGRLPFVISATCLTGQITHSPSFAEEWLLREKAIAVFAADEIFSTYWNDRITPQIFRQIVTCGKRQLGEILVGAMRAMHTKYGDHDNFTRETYRMFRLLGDPDTILTTPDDATYPTIETTAITLKTPSSTPVYSISGESRVRLGRRVRRASVAITGWRIPQVSSGSGLPPASVPSVVETKVSVVSISGSEVVLKAEVRLAGQGVDRRHSVELNLSVLALVDL